MTDRIRTLLSDTLAGHRMTEGEALTLLGAKGRDIWAIAAAADEVREQKAGDAVTFVLNQNLHITNICKNLCGFCGFGRKATDPDAYMLGKEQVQAQARNAGARGVTEVCFLSGVHPAFTMESYEEMIGWVREVLPDVDIHACSPEEVFFAAERSGIPTVEALERLRAAGLGTLQGTAAEILVDEVRDVICPKKVRTADWVRIIREAHLMGIRSSGTIMYGSYESDADRARHLGILREIQDETGGFTELVTLPYIHQHTPLYQAGIARPGSTGREDILLIAVSRLFLDNFQNVQVSWGKVGTKMAQVCLLAGANDLGGTMFADAVTVSAGADEADYLDPAAMRRIAEDLGRPLVQRTTTYGRA
ncbi:5-amino-6-(D-ribitylamino)uracil--L-tyrosine 4-hydroxyphenyl transferase CofH [Methanofollis tationis]|uniref:5-amino-6-(D-ribitylamino)uracil--L-tyrosine 4-hydroxyphenyl transferase CofH n=1 Tax=Methanofollis tationis TaxID=81417 RepID=A0A7K4HNX7_9EURY|nr:5-amino-6-(D-ribitylamino)uracil--L-tyrosine 4-hydroxyphenyl transferase CofH [Methanofollis tationis]NVO66986.1 5-amino-6-(D-ribitylamino)uracil--L-tyrosine 4-hydroxyphenyl transferase CofH [Methanofollis tationis]